jgi:hypothetical protein
MGLPEKGIGWSRQRPRIAAPSRRGPSRAASKQGFDDGFDDIPGGFDDVRYAPVALNPLICKETAPRRM